MYPIVLNSTHAIDKNTYEYKFPRGTVKFFNSEVALAQVNLYYSWPNITAINNNQTFKFIWPDGSGPQFTEYTVTVPEGNYTIEDLDAYLQYFCIQNGLYLVNSSGLNVYYVQFLANPQTYKIDFISRPIPTALPAGYSNPGSMTFPNTSHPPTLLILENDFGKLIGFEPGGYFTASSTFTPQVSPVSSILVTCSLINNPLSNPSNIFYSFTTAGVKYGSMINVVNQDVGASYSPITDGLYQSVVIKFITQDFKPLNILDQNLIIYLVIRQNV